MIKKTLIFSIFSMVLVGCFGEKNDNEIKETIVDENIESPNTKFGDKTEPAEIIGLRELVEVGNITSIILIDETGKYELPKNKDVFRDFLYKLSTISLDQKLTLAQKESIEAEQKVSISLVVEGKSYNLYTDNNNKYLVVASDIVTKNQHNINNDKLVSFKTNGLNINEFINFLH